MNYSEVKKELKKEFESFLKPLGYKSKSGTQGCSFFLNRGFVEYRFGYGVANYGDEFNSGLFGSIGMLPIQLIENRIFNEESFTDTLLLNKSDYFKDINYRFKITSLNDVKEWSTIAKKFYHEFAIPFFEKYNSVDAIDKLLNEKPSEKVIYCDDLGWRIIKGLISAKLNNNPKYNELRDYYRSEVESKFQGHFMYEKCMKAIDFLDKHTREELLKIAES
ncbi:MAG: hypothetical protein ACK5WO_15505 [Cyclobacteriaceae bacterium]|jgi:hypothetical protein